MNVISLFSGCGGLDLGFLKAGFNIVWANDFDKDAVDSYRSNIGHHIVHDSIYNINPNDIPDADIIIGGFPCLGFTVAKGKSRTLDCDYNKLFKEYARILDAKNPKYFLVENVTGIKSGEEFNNFFHNVILKAFESAGFGYKVKYATLIATSFGVPQKRKRIIILGTRKDILIEPEFPDDLLLDSTKFTTLRDAIGDLPISYDSLIPNHTGNKHTVKINGYVGNRLLDLDSPSPTITGRGSRSGGAVIHPHPSLQRRLTVRECARIQSFPDDFIFSGSNGACYSQIGNAVPPLMAFFIANQFREAFLLDKIILQTRLFKLPYIEKIVEVKNNLLT